MDCNDCPNMNPEMRKRPVTLLRDFPRISVKAGETAYIVAEKAPDVYEILTSHGPLIVWGEWIKREEAAK